MLLFPNCPLVADGEPCSCAMLGGDPISCAAAGAPVTPFPFLSEPTGSNERTMAAFFGSEPA